MNTDLKRGRSKRLDSGGDRLPPHAQEAEQALLGCCLLEWLPSLNACEEGGVTREWFYDLRHQLLYHAMQELFKAGTAVDVVTLAEQLKNKGLLEEAGGIGYLASLPEAAPSASSLPHYLAIVQEKYLLRGVVKCCVAAVNEIYSDTPPEAPGLVEQLEKELIRLAEAGSEGNERLLRAVLDEVIAELEDYHRGHAQIHGLTTGLEYVDKFLCGLGGKNGNYVVLGGRPGTGKTSLALQIATHAACEFVWFDPVLDAAGQPVLEEVDGKERFKCTRKVGVPVGIFSLEMQGNSLVERMLFNAAGADMQRWRTGFAEKDAVPLLVQASRGLFAGNAVVIEDSARLRIDQVRAKARRWRRQYGIKLLVIDYIQLLKASGKRFRDDRVQELSEISAELQALGKELNLPIVVLAQMNRDYEKEPTRQPRLADLKDCGSIEQDADLVGFLYTPRLGEKEKKEYDTAMAEVFPDVEWGKIPKRVNVLWAKNRYGPTGVNQLLFQKSCTKFFDWVNWLKTHGQRALAQGERLPGMVEEEDRSLTTD